MNPVDRFGAVARETLLEFCAPSMRSPREAGLAILLLEIPRSDPSNGSPDCPAHRLAWERAAASIPELIGADRRVLLCGEHVLLMLLRVPEADSAERLAREIWSRAASQLEVPGTETGGSVSGGCVFALNPRDRWPDNLLDVLIQTVEVTAKEARLTGRTKFIFRRLLFSAEGVWVGDKLPARPGGPVRRDEGRLRHLDVHAPQS